MNGMGKRLNKLESHAPGWVHTIGLEDDRASRIQALANYRREVGTIAPADTVVFFIDKYVPVLG